jgi:hypothetical protein
MQAEQSQIDRAREWTNESYPDAEGDEYEARFANALADIVALDESDT